MKNKRNLLLKKINRKKHKQDTSHLHAVRPMTGSMEVKPLELTSLPAVKNVLLRVGVDSSYIEKLSRKFIFRTFLITRLDNRAANILKQEMLSLGAEAAVSKHISHFKTGTSSVVIGGTEKQYAGLVKKLSLQPFGLKEVGIRLQSFIQGGAVHVFDCRGQKFECGMHPVIMGILNVTPDSFHDGGNFFKRNTALKQAEKLHEEGADIIDVGGESSRPGADFVDEDEEKRRVIPIVEVLAEKGFCVSIDTRRSAIAEAALDAGAQIVNDISAMRHSPDMARVVQKAHAAVVLMHMQGTPKTMQAAPSYTDVVGDVKQFFKERIQYARGHYIRPDRIILDPGIGFGKTLEHNVSLIRHIHAFEELGYPLLIGASRKSFIEMQMRRYHDKPLPAAERLPGSLAVAVEAFRKGIRIFRVHDVAATRQALIMAEAFKE